MQMYLLFIFKGYFNQWLVDLNYVTVLNRICHAENDLRFNQTIKIRLVIKPLNKFANYDYKSSKAKLSTPNDVFSDDTTQLLL